jgi:hypothetical protein
MVAGYICRMSKKSITALTPDELDRLAAEAWFEASQSSLKAGVGVVGREGGKVIKNHPDGRTEILRDAAPLENIER